MARGEGGQSRTISHEGSSQNEARTRGRMQGLPVQDNRIAASIINFKIFHPISMKKRIGQIVKTHIKRPCISWAEWTGDEKDAVWKSVLQIYNFQTEQKTMYARWAFHSYMLDAYRGWMYKARQSAMKLAKVDYLDNTCKSYPPSYLVDTVWGEMVDKWLKESWSSSSMKGRQNRGKTQHIIYSGGSMPIEGHIIQMRKELGRHPTEFEVFHRTHKNNREEGAETDVCPPTLNNETECIHPRAKELKDKYDKVVSEMWSAPEVEESVCSNNICKCY